MLVSEDDRVSVGNCVVMGNLHSTWQLCISSDKQQVSNISVN